MRYEHLFECDVGFGSHGAGAHCLFNRNRDWLYALEKEMSDFDRNLRAALIAELQVIRERTEVMLELLLPESYAECPHPPDKVQDISAMGEDSIYRCSLCGVEQAVPFHTFQE